jgi:hypothetical protein
MTRKSKGKLRERKEEIAEEIKRKGKKDLQKEKASVELAFFYNEKWMINCFFFP